MLKYRTLIVGLLSPFAAAFLGQFVYRTLTRASADRDADFVFRLSVTALAMAVPFLITLTLAMLDRGRSAFGTSSKVGLAIGLLSLGLTWLPIRGVISRQQQATNLSLQNVDAPTFETVDIHGNPQSLSDHAGKVVLFNIWATWCGPCRREMPELDRLYQERKDDGLMVFGLSTEELDLQREFAQDVPVTYPLLTTDGEVPEIYTTTARYPANFLIDRQGKLQPAPSAEEPFENLEAAVEALLDEN